MKKSKLLGDKRVILLIAVVIAVLSWIIIAGFINPGSRITIPNVPIDYERGAQTYADRNLQIVGTPEDGFADVRVQGDGSVLGTLNETSVTVYVDYSYVTGPGTYELPLRVEKLTSGFTVVGVSVRSGGHDVEANPKDTATVTFEEISRAVFPIVPKTDDISVPTGFAKGTVAADPTEVTITGPKTKVDQIGQVWAVVAEVKEIEATERFASIPLTLIDKNGEEMDQSEMSLVFSSPTATVTVPVLERRTINLDVGLTGVPQGMDEEWLRSKLKLSHETVDVMGLPSAFAHLDDPYLIWDVDVSTLELNWESDPITITLPEGLRIEGDMRQVTVSLDSSEMSEITVEVPAANIKVVNAPANTTVTPVADSISVRLLGDSAQIEALLPDNITVQLDATTVTTGGGGQQTVAARILIPKYHKMFAVSGEAGYSMVCDVEVN